MPAITVPPRRPSHALAAGATASRSSRSCSSGAGPPRAPRTRRRRRAPPSAWSPASRSRRTGRHCVFSWRETSGRFRRAGRRVATDLPSRHGQPAARLARWEDAGIRLESGWSRRGVHHAAHRGDADPPHRPHRGVPTDRVAPRRRLALRPGVPRPPLAQGRALLPAPPRSEARAPARLRRVWRKRCGSRPTAAGSRSRARARPGGGRGTGAARPRRSGSTTARKLRIGS